MRERGAFLDRNEALQLEAKEFGHIARTQAASAMVQNFLNDQAVKRSARQAAKGAAQVRSAAVLGAGIMGGGIAFISALRGIPVRVRDVRAESLEQANEETSKQIAKQVISGRLNETTGAEILQKITMQLDFVGFDSCDFVIEAIIEDLDIKRRVISDLEARLAPSAFIASNTSSLRIDDIASCLEDPTRLVGMHFFNPVPQMPLVEIVRGTHTSDAAVATAVAYASAMGKTPIVVRDCPGFLVNRVLTAYMRGFLQLVNDGADFSAIDKAMEAFGWPMGPAYLEDVVGIDTGSHVNDVISSGYPDRMPHLADDPLRLMKRLGRFGQKSGVGFYRYERNAKGKPIRSLAEDTETLLKQLQPNGPRAFSDEEIVDRMMLPMVLEAARALDEGIVASAAELDIAITLGLGFPGYAGGPLKYADWLSLPEVITRCERLSHMGAAYQPGAALRALAAANGRFH
jgi:3-hydroxyacyl-CoA dehydrogenase/enoyl-CoA hydratase/3-hydroxybutyryl-CoA epimerase/enoyl-CoA isomerase